MRDIPADLAQQIVDAADELDRNQHDGWLRTAMLKNLDRLVLTVLREAIISEARMFLMRGKKEE